MTAVEKLFRSLEVQGAPFDGDKAATFAKQSHAEDGAQLRRWDEEAKDGDAVAGTFPPLRGNRASLAVPGNKPVRRPTASSTVPAPFGQFHPMAIPPRFSGGPLSWRLVTLL